MSAIAGILRFDGKPAELALIEAMTLKMTRRGPDGRNVWAHGPVALGHCMLHATPESLGEQQPFLIDSARIIREL